MSPPAYARRAIDDRDNLRRLAAVHLVLAVIAGIGAAYSGYVLAKYFRLMGEMELHRNMAGPSMTAYNAYVVFLALLPLAFAMLNLLSGLCLRACRRRTFSLVVASLNCLLVPFGTVLGVFTIVILLRESVRGLYEAEAAGMAREAT